MITEKRINYKAGANLELIATCKLPTKFNQGAIVEVSIFDYKNRKNEVIALVHRKNLSNDSKIPLVRIHSACITGEIFGSEKCDCGSQFQIAMEQICSSNYGMMLYMSTQEGRGIGIENKIRAYKLQEEGANTIEANELLGFPEDMRSYQSAVAVLKYYNISGLRLLTNNPNKINALQKEGIHVIKRLPMAPTINTHNINYILTKQNILNHDFGKIIG